MLQSRETKSDSFAGCVKILNRSLIFKHKTEVVGLELLTCLVDYRVSGYNCVLEHLDLFLFEVLLDLLNLLSVSQFVVIYSHGGIGQSELE